MKRLLSISFVVAVTVAIGMSQVDYASGQKAANISKGFTDSIVERRESKVALDGPVFESIFSFSSTELRQISGRYAAEGSNVHVYAMHEYWDKINARIDSQRTRVLIP